MTRGTGLVEGFCTYDTGHDNSPRWQGIPPQCPDKDAKKHPPIPTLPRLCPDLSATVYGGRIALSAMARAMGKTAESDHWRERAEQIRGLILSRLYVEEDAAFYDLDARNHFVKIRCDILSRMCGEHIPDQALFDDLWARQIHNPKAFWAPWPLPSVALDDPRFVRPIPRNSWGGASQALTALRAGRWFDHYGRRREFAGMMDRWCDALQADMSFRQQFDPLNGKFTKADMPNYSPAALVMLDYTWRLAGVREGENGSLEWNVRPGHPAAQAALFRMRTDAGPTAEMKYDRRGAELRLGSKVIGRIDSGTARLVTDSGGVPKALVGIGERSQTVEIRLRGRALREVALQPNVSATSDVLRRLEQATNQDEARSATLSPHRRLQWDRGKPRLLRHRGPRKRGRRGYAVVYPRNGYAPVGKQPGRDPCQDVPRGSLLAETRTKKSPTPRRGNRSSCRRPPPRRR